MKREFTMSDGTKVFREAEVRKNFLVADDDPEAWKTVPELYEGEEWLETFEGGGVIIVVRRP